VLGPESLARVEHEPVARPAGAELPDAHDPEASSNRG